VSRESLHNSPPKAPGKTTDDVHAPRLLPAVTEEAHNQTWIKHPFTETRAAQELCIHPTFTPQQVVALSFTPEPPVNRVPIIATFQQAVSNNQVITYIATCNNLLLR
jgi:hypothetical protein